MEPEIISNDFARTHPHIAEWVEDGVIEIGRGYAGPFIKVIKAIFGAIQKLLTPPEEPKRNRIGGFGVE